MCGGVFYDREQTSHTKQQCRYLQRAKSNRKVNTYQRYGYIRPIRRHRLSNKKRIKPNLKMTTIEMNITDLETDQKSINNIFELLQPMIKEGANLIGAIDKSILALKFYELEMYLNHAQKMLESEIYRQQLIKSNKC